MVARSSLHLALLVTVVVAVSGCTAWEDTRRDIVDPVNQLVHVDYPAAIRDADSERVTGLCIPELSLWAAGDCQQISGLFTRIDRSRCVIHDADPPDDLGQVRTECVLRFDGIRDGERFTWEQERTITVRPGDDGWKICRVETGRLRQIEAATVFSEEAAERGLVAPSRSRGTLDRQDRTQHYLMSSGVAVGDIDGDSDDDLLMLSGDQLRLFRNDGGRFENVTAASGIVTPDQGECRCGYFADIDNDGDQDLLVAMFAGEVMLFENTGAGRFQLIPAAVSGLETAHGNVASACFGDFDSDGDLDLVLASGNNIYRVDPTPENNARNGFADQYYRNDGTGRFTDATSEAGLGATGWALACAVSDYDRDGDLDIFIANDVGVDVMYRNRGDGTFEDVTQAVGCVFPGSSMSADFGDVNGDGWPDLYTSGMASNSRWLLHQPGFPVPVPFPLNLLFHQRALDNMWQMYHGNRLYLNNQDGTFREASIEARSFWFGWAWSAVFLDYDNDGLLDIYGANGFWTGEEAEDC